MVVEKFVLNGIRSLDCPACSKSLYRLSYLGQWCMQVGLILISCVLGIWKTFSLFCAKCILLCKFLGYHSGVDEDSSLLG